MGFSWPPAVATPPGVGKAEGPHGPVVLASCGLVVGALWKEATQWKQWSLPGKRRGKVDRRSPNAEVDWTFPIGTLSKTSQTNSP